MGAGMEGGPLHPDAFPRPRPPPAPSRDSIRLPQESSYDKSEGDTPLHCVAGSGSAACVQALLAMGGPGVNALRGKVRKPNAALEAFAGGHSTLRMIDRTHPCALLFRLQTIALKRPWS